MTIRGRSTVRERLAARRLPRRRGLTTLSLSGRPVLAPPPPFAAVPEVTERSIWLRRLPAAYDGLRIVQLTDLHHSLYTPLEDIEHAVHLANGLEPDIVALTGDYVTLSPAYIRPVARSLGKLRARLGVFAVLGNHDFQVDADEITRELEAHHIRVLRNASHPLRAAGRSSSHGSHALWLVGVDDLWWKADDLPGALEGVPARDTKLLLCHNPLGVWQAASHGVDLVLSGHTHGGQVRLPVVGSVYGRSKLGERFVEGWNRVNGTQIYVSRGIGKVLVPIRFGCPPEVTCLELRRSERE